MDIKEKYKVSMRNLNVKFKKFKKSLKTFNILKINKLQEKMNKNYTSLNYNLIFLKILKYRISFIFALQSIFSHNPIKTIYPKFLNVFKCGLIKIKYYCHSWREEKCL